MSNSVRVVSYSLPSRYLSIFLYNSSTLIYSPIMNISMITLIFSFCWSCYNFKILFHYLLLSFSTLIISMLRTLSCTRSNWPVYLCILRIFVALSVHMFHLELGLLLWVIRLRLWLRACYRVFIGYNDFWDQPFYYYYSYLIILIYNAINIQCNYDERKHAYHKYNKIINRWLLNLAYIRLNLKILLNLDNKNIKWD